MSDDAHPFAHLFDRMRQQQDGEPPPKMLPEAQVANLRAAWEHYTSPKSFTPGQLVKERKGLGVLKSEPVLIFVRKLDLSVPEDEGIAASSHSNLRWNKVDCIIAFCGTSGTVDFHCMDSDLLEPYEP